MDNIIYIWSRMYPSYVARMRAMAHPANIHNAFYAADMMFLVPKE